MKKFNLIIFLFLWIMAGSAQAVTFTAQRLPDRFSAMALNNRGQIVGPLYSEDWSSFHAAIWDQGNLTDLGTLEGVGSSNATDINDNGQIIGYSSTTSGYGHYFFYENGTMTDIGRYQAKALNDMGTVLVYASYNNSFFTWNKGSGLSSRLGYGQPEDINNNGQITGTNNSKTFIWDPTTGMQEVFGMIGAGINDSGHIAINNFESGTMAYMAYLWKSDSDYQNLGTLGGTGSSARAINDSDWIVGRSETAAGEWHTFLWIDGTMYDLNDLVMNLDDTVVLNDVLDINDSGQILTFDYLLTPVSETPVPVPSTVVLLMSGLAFIGVSRKHKLTRIKNNHDS